MATKLADINYIRRFGEIHDANEQLAQIANRLNELGLIYGQLYAVKANDPHLRVAEDFSEMQVKNINYQLQLLRVDLAALCLKVGDMNDVEL